MKFGIDISKWQDNFDFDQAILDGVEFIILKCGEGTSNNIFTDSKFYEYYEKAKKRNIPIGTYWVSSLTSDIRIKKETEYIYKNILEGRRFELPIYIDIEYNIGSKALLLSKKRRLTDYIKLWCNILEEKNYWVGIYSSIEFFKYKVFDKELQRYSHWVGQWGMKCSYNSACLGMWQFRSGDSADIKGGVRPKKIANQNVDQNYMLKDYPNLIKKKGKNGF